MKKLILLMVLLGTSVFSQEWKLPAGTTYRVKGVGYDCGKFFKGYTQAPSEYKERGINFYILTADKHLNTFSVEASWTTEVGEECIYGLFFNRARETRTLELEYTLDKSSGTGESCLANQQFLRERLKSTPYYASKRGTRYIAIDVINEENEVCRGPQVRAVFDRRAP